MEEQVKKELDLTEIAGQKQAELIEFVQENGKSLKLDEESLSKGELALDNDKEYVVSGKFLNEALAYLSRATIMKAKFSEMVNALDVNTSALSLTVDSLSLEAMKAIRKAQTQNLLD